MHSTKQIFPIFAGILLSNRKISSLWVKVMFALSAEKSSIVPTEMLAQRVAKKERKNLTLSIQIRIGLNFKPILN